MQLSSKHPGDISVTAAPVSMRQEMNTSLMLADKSSDGGDSKLVMMAVLGAFLSDPSPVWPSTSASFPEPWEDLRIPL